eukprot:tig00000254_g22586.t1
MARQLQQLAALAERGRGLAAPAVVRVVRRAPRKKSRPHRSERGRAAERSRSRPRAKSKQPTASAARRSDYDYGASEAGAAGHAAAPPLRGGTQVVTPVTAEEKQRRAAAAAAAERGGALLEHAHALGDLHLVDARRVPSKSAVPSGKAAAAQPAPPPAPEGPSYFEQAEAQQRQRAAREADDREARALARGGAGAAGAQPGASRGRSRRCREGQAAARAEPPAARSAAAAAVAAPADPSAKQWRLNVTLVEAGKLPQGKAVYRAQVHVGTGKQAGGEPWDVGEVGPAERPYFNATRTFTLVPPVELALLTVGIFAKTAAGSFAHVAEGRVSLAGYAQGQGGSWHEQFRLQSADLGAVLPEAYVELKIAVSPMR